MELLQPCMKSFNDFVQECFATSMLLAIKWLSIILEHFQYSSNGDTSLALHDQLCNNMDSYDNQGNIVILFEKEFKYQWWIDLYTFTQILTYSFGL